jgi:NAD(P)-dependent dehydrogenase (short-subunit alcohol dehydrogenase family)
MLSYPSLMIFSCPSPSRSAYEGANLLLHHHEKEVKDVENLTKYINENSPSTKFEFIAGDLSKLSEVEKLADKAKSCFNGEVHVLFNNHATQQEVESLTDLADEQWTHVFDTNM